jgi:membrane protease YdiL (CAAX protease family)
MTGTTATGFWTTVILLLRSSRRRSQGRQRRQQELLNQRGASNLGSLATVLAVMMMALMHGLAAYAVISGVKAAQYESARQRGMMVVSEAFAARAQMWEQSRGKDAQDLQAELEERYADEARAIAKRDGGDPTRVEQSLRASVAAHGGRQLVSREDAVPGLGGLGGSGPLAATLGSVMVLWWLAMLVCQGEGLELDLQRRRNPMWEWLLSHPVRAGAVFLAEMLMPLASNPTYWTAPLFIGILYGVAQDPGKGLLAALVIGPPLAVAAGCMGKALEIGAMLRMPVLRRGAFIGIVSWFGYASLVGMFVVSLQMPKVVPALQPVIGPVVKVIGPVVGPVLGLMLGLSGDGTFSWLRGMVFCWALSGALITASVVFCARSIRQGLSGAFASDSLPARASGKTRFGRQPLFRKEMLWFIRDRSAIVQTILIPITVAGVQIFNFRGVLAHAEDSWNYLCGAAIFFGTYFLWVLGPKSLNSEGSALWIALTWPRGLESLLKAKAWLWSMLASGLVVLVMLAGCWLFPQDAWKIALVAVAWFLFARSMADKAVTLVTVTSELGEARKPPSGRRWGAQLGMLTFAIGICTQQWHLAVVGIVYAWITAAAMWENLRAHLPYLYDPWSEVLPPPPTLMHAMIAISAMIECVSVLTALLAAIGGHGSLAVAQGVSYAVCAVGASLGAAYFLVRRGVSPRDIWTWSGQSARAASGLGRWLSAGLCGGIALGGVAHAYVQAMRLIPGIDHMIRASDRQMHSVPGMVVAYAVMAIGFAPFAEEFLFRGLLYRALDRQWGGWRAVTGAAAFFAIYHSPLAWVPVALVGAVNALLFKRSGSLWPAVLLHMTYNTVVVFWP